MMVMAMFGLVVSSLLATSGVAALGVEAQVALAQSAPSTNAAAVELASSSGLTEAQIQAVLGLLAAFNVDQATIDNVGAILRGSTPAPNPTPNPTPAPTALSVSMKPISSTTITPGTRLTLAMEKLDATQSGEDIQVGGLPLQLVTNTMSAYNDLNSCTVVESDVGTTLTTGTHVINTILWPGIIQFTFDNPLTVAKGTVANLSITCNVSSAAPAGDTLKFVTLQEQSGSTSNGVYMATGASSGTHIIPTTYAGQSGPYTISSGGTLTVATDASSPAYQIVAGGTTGVTATSFNLQASGESMSLQQIGLDLAAQSASPSDVIQAHVYQGSTLIGTAIFTDGSPTGNCPSAYTGTLSGGCYFATTTISSSAALAQNSQTNFTIKLDVASIGTAQPGKAGDNIIIGLADAEALGLNSGAIVHSGSAPNQAGVRIFRSYPTVLQLSPLQSTLVSGSNVLIRFGVTANSSGPVGISQLWITPRSVSAPMISVGTLSLYAFTDPAFSQPIASFSNGAIYTGNTGKITLTQPLEIPAGQTYYIEAVAPISGITQNSGVTITLGGDGNQTLGNALTTYAGESDSAFVWSPNDKTTSQFSDNDWTNGYSIPGLPASGISQTITGSGSIGQVCPPGTTGIYPVCVSSNPMPPTVVIAQSRNTKLVQIGNNYYLYPIGGSSGPELLYNGAPYQQGQSGNVNPLGAEKIANGYEVIWKAANTSQYIIWTTDSSGNENYATSLTVSQLQYYETDFGQDFNGDGIIGAPASTSPVTTATTTTIVAWGDSLTYGYGAPTGGSYPEQLATLTGDQVINEGESGDNSQTILSRFLAAPPAYYGEPTIIWAGRNNVSASNFQSQVESDIASMVAKLTTSHYLVLGVPNTENEVAGSTNYNNIIKLNNDLAAIYGSHYVDVRASLVSHYDPSIAQDVTDHANDTPPSSLLHDYMHPNAAGYLVVAQRVQAALAAQGVAAATPSARVASSNMANLANAFAAIELSPFRLIVDSLASLFLRRA